MGKELLSESKTINSPDHANSPSHDGKKLSKEEKEKLKKRERKQRQKQNRKTRKNQNPPNENPEEVIKSNNGFVNNDIEIEYVERDEYLLTGKYYEEFKNVFQYFATPKIDKMPPKQDYDDNYSNNEEGLGNNNAPFDNDNEGVLKEIKKTKEVKLSRKKRKQLKMLKVAQLKALVKRPDVVEVFSKHLTKFNSINY